MFFLAASEAEYRKSTRIIRFADTSGTPFGERRPACGAEYCYRLGKVRSDFDTG